MLLNLILQKYNNMTQDYQSKLPLNVDCIIPDNDSVRLLSQVVEEMGISALYSTYSRSWKNTAKQKRIMLYAYMNCMYSVRDID